MTGGTVPQRRLLQRVAIGALCLLLVGGCYGADPSGSPSQSDDPTLAPSASASFAPSQAIESQPVAPSHSPESDDPAVALMGRALEALGEGGVDVVARLGAPGFRLPEGERLYDVHGDRVLAARSGTKGAPAVLVVRDLEGELVREISSGMHVPQTGIVRGDDVYFGGVDLGPVGMEYDQASDRGVWVAHGDAPPVPVLSAEDGVAVYTAFERSPDGRTVGVWRCGQICATILIKPGGDSTVVPRPGLIALTNGVALVIGAFSDVTAYAIDSGDELWRAETTGAYYERYATSDGARIVLSSIEDVGDDTSTTDQLRIELLDALTGAVERTVLLSTEQTLLFVEAELSTDRYVAILDTVLPNVDAGPHAVHVVDLEAGRLLDITLTLGDVP